MERITPRQKTLLLNMIEKHMHMINGRFQSVNGAQYSDGVWKVIQKKANMIGPSKSITQWKKCWKDLRLGVKGKLTKLRQYQTVTGMGEHSSIQLSENDERILRLIGIDDFYGLEEVPEKKPNIVTSPLRITPDDYIEYSFHPEDFAELTTPIATSSHLPISTANPSQPLTNTSSVTDEQHQTFRKTTDLNTAVDRSINNQVETHNLLRELIMAVNKTNEILLKYFNQDNP